VVHVRCGSAVHHHLLEGMVEALLNERTKKQQITFTISEKMLKYLRENLPDHMSRSCFTEHMFWKGVEFEKNNVEQKYGK
jgi:hypothetical protein